MALSSLSYPFSLLEEILNIYHWWGTYGPYPFSRYNHVLNVHLHNRHLSLSVPLPLRHSFPSSSALLPIPSSFYPFSILSFLAFNCFILSSTFFLANYFRNRTMSHSLILTRTFAVIVNFVLIVSAVYTKMPFDFPHRLWTAGVKITA